MMYVLLVITAVNSGVAFNATDFSSLDACEKAKEWVVSAQRGLKSPLYLVAGCKPK